MLENTFLTTSFPVIKNRGTGGHSSFKNTLVFPQNQYTAAYGECMCVCRQHSSNIISALGTILGGVPESGPAPQSQHPSSRSSPVELLLQQQLMHEHYIAVIGATAGTGNPHRGGTPVHPPTLSVLHSASLPLPSSPAGFAQHTNPICYIPGVEVH